MARFIRFPWATTGDKTEVPFPTDPGGTVSYAQGFGPNYELPNTDPNYEPVPRDLTNGLYFDLTDNIRQYQLNGAPDWHPAADNDGVAISYPVNAVVRWDDLVYRSIVAGNTVEPGTDATKWVVDGVAGAATTSVAGLTRYATTAEAAARTINNAAVTPLGLGALFDLLLNQPIYPEVNTTDGLFTITAPSTGTVRIAAGTTWTHRGAFLYTSALTDLATVANKTYHLRWDRTNGFALYDLSNGTYNPSSLAETNSSFDTTYDSMLVARVTTSAGNVATITPLANKAQLRTTLGIAGTPQANQGLTDARFAFSASFNWARTPASRSLGITAGTNEGTMPDNDFILYGAFPTFASTLPATRYGSNFVILWDYREIVSVSIALSA